MRRFILVSACSLFSCLPMVSQVGVARRPAEAPLATEAPQLTARVKVMFHWDATSSDSSNAISVRDAASGMPTGKRMHKPFVITKELDKSTPLLFTAMRNHKTIPSMELSYEGPPPFASCAKSTGYDLKSGTKGKVSLQDISIVKIEKTSPTTEEITLDYGSMSVLSNGAPVVCDASPVLGSR